MERGRPRPQQHSSNQPPLFLHDALIHLFDFPVFWVFHG
jgi:hypothetical protein